ncbi:MAG: hypothetical protein ORN49_06770 [Rhodobacteraceae bacterium]|nr:hypothetical protein [Paracoccaceae bacterium]
MAALWKIPRELRRLRQQAMALIEPLYEGRIQARHDKAFDAGFPLHEGEIARGGKVALLLIYQPRGLDGSMIEMLDLLVRQNYAPLVVSNGPLTAEALARLLPRAWRLLVRPNVGYDFGGYRDGIRSLWRWQISPDNLLIMNDSVWVSLKEGGSLIARLEASPADLTGTILRHSDKGDFLESYCYHLPRRTFDHPAFRRYWKDLRLTSNKYKVIRRGERAHSGMLMRAGLTVKPAYSNTAFRDVLEKVEDGYLRQMLRHAAFTEEDMVADCQAVLRQPDGPGWRAAALAHVDRTLARVSFHCHYPVGAVDLMGYPLLKKSNDRMAKHWRFAYMGALNAGALPLPPPAVLHELQALSRRDMGQG